MTFANPSCLLLQAAVSMLKQEYKEGETNLKQALDLSIKVLSKTLDTTKLTPDKGKQMPDTRLLQLQTVLKVNWQAYSTF